MKQEAQESSTDLAKTDKRESEASSVSNIILQNIYKSITTETTHLKPTERTKQYQSKRDVEAETERGRNLIQSLLSHLPVVPQGVRDAEAAHLLGGTELALEIDPTNDAQLRHVFQREPLRGMILHGVMSVGAVMTLV